MMFMSIACEPCLITCTGSLQLVLLVLTLAGFCGQAASPGGSGKVDKALQDHCHGPTVLFHLLPLPKLASVKRPCEASSNGDGKAGKCGKPTKSGKSGKPGKAGKTGFVPEALKGLSGTRNGVRLCFNYNLAHGCTLECKDVNGNQVCSRGAHLCMKCGGTHSASTREA